METIPRHSNVSHSLEFGFHCGSVSVFFESTPNDASLRLALVVSKDADAEVLGCVDSVGILFFAVVGLRSLISVMMIKFDETLKGKKELRWERIYSSAGRFAVQPGEQLECN